MGCAPRPRGLPAASSRWGRATIGHEELIVLIDQIYEAALDGGLWPGVLIKFADAIGAAHVSITSRDRSTNTFASITPRTDLDFVASYREYWAFQNRAPAGRRDLFARQPYGARGLLRDTRL